MNEDELINSFDAALKDGSIFAVYQPQINHATGRMIGAEALMRWKDPEFGMQLRDSRNGYQAVGDLKTLLDYWKNGLPFSRPEKLRTSE